MKPQAVNGDFYALLAALLWGVNYPLVKFVLRSIPEQQFVLVRFLAAAVILNGYAWLAGERVWRGWERAALWRLAFLGLVGVGAYNIVWTAGIHRTTAANAALLVSTAPIFTVMYTAWRGEEPVGAWQWLGGGLAFAGVYGIVAGTPGGLSFGADVFVGNLLVLGCAVLFALYGIVARPLLVRHSPIKVTTAVMTLGLCVLAPYGLAGGRVAAPSWPAWWGMGFIVLLGTVAAYVCWYGGIRQASPAKAVIFHNLVPVISMGVGAILLGEETNAGRLLGAVLVLTGVIVTKLAPKRLTIDFVFKKKELNNDVRSDR